MVRSPIARAEVVTIARTVHAHAPFAARAP